MNIYDTDKLLAEYLLFHYGTADEIALPAFAAGALNFPVRCVTECVEAKSLPENARALDLGCAVGRSSFELARLCPGVVSVDSSQQFIDAAQDLRLGVELPYERTDEGELTTRLLARAPADVDRLRVKFETGDAMALRSTIGTFDVVLMANLIDRLRAPQRCLARLRELVKHGGQLVITSPCTWLEEFTPRGNWLGGIAGSTLDGLKAALKNDFELTGTRDLPFVIREHARKFQLGVAQASLWKRR